jgi:hypothetical protein
VLLSIYYSQRLKRMTAAWDDEFLAALVAT